MAYSDGGMVAIKKDSEIDSMIRELDCLLLLVETIRAKLTSTNQAFLGGSTIAENGAKEVEPNGKIDIMRKRLKSISQNISVIENETERYQEAVVGDAPDRPH